MHMHFFSPTTWFKIHKLIGVRKFGSSEIMNVSISEIPTFKKSTEPEKRMLHLLVRNVGGSEIANFLISEVSTFAKSRRAAGRGGQLCRYLPQLQPIKAEYMENQWKSYYSRETTEIII